MTKIDILKTRLKNNERILLNGGTGTEILHRGFETSVPLWSAEVLLSHPSIVQNIHEDYIKAGAEIIVTNTFRTTERSFAKKGLSAKKATQITKLACTLAKNAIKKVNPKFDVFIAGSVAPLEDCYSPELTPSEEELRKEHYVYIKNLKEGGVDFILIETQITIKEINAALDAAKKLHIPTAISLCVNNDLQLLSGETLEEIITLATKYNPLFIGINCVRQELATKAIKKIRKLTSLPIAVYAQGNGIPEDNLGWKFFRKDKGAQYTKYAQQWIANGAQIIGGCCGTTPEYIYSISKILNQ